MIFKKVGRAFFSLLLFWIIVFDFQRLVFTIHHLPLLEGQSFLEWIKVFFYSFRLDLASASIFSALPFLFLLFYIITQKKLIYHLFFGVLMFELLIATLIHVGEINAYEEWGSKLTSRVFNHLIHPDEVIRTADIGMIFWFFFYGILEIFLGWRITRWLLKRERFNLLASPFLAKVITFFPILPLGLAFYLLLARGGVQPIPINVDAAHFSKNYVINDISINTPYYFGKSFLLYQRADISHMLSTYSEEEIKETLQDFYTYDATPSVEILKTKTPNIVFIVLESWSAKASQLITGYDQGATPEFDALAKEGLLFTNIHSASNTSEIGNATIFSGYPALPEIFITMQADKQRKLRTLNQSLKSRNYSSAYYFGGDLNYGNIGSYFKDHGVDIVYDEKDFPKHIQRGKLNYYDEDLYSIFLSAMKEAKEPFLYSAFTGSTHSPYDCPPPKKSKWEGKMSDYMNSMLYADEALADFVEAAKNEKWYENTLFIFVADHGHNSPEVSHSGDPEFFHIPLLFYGPALKEEFRGQQINTLGSQADIAQTLLKQLGVDEEEYYPWSKNLLSDNVPEFATVTAARHFGWITPKGKFTYSFETNKYISNSFSEEDLETERKRCDAFMQVLYKEYLKL